MNTYVLTAFRGKKTLYPHADPVSQESVRGSDSFWLEAFQVSAGNGKAFTRYRLHTGMPICFSDSLEYDIKCPRCGNTMRFCGKPCNDQGYGVYKCRSCDEEGM